MRYLGIDYGKKRIGLSYGDELGLATPLPAATAHSESTRLLQIVSVIEQRSIEALVIGYPYNMDGSSGFMTEEVDHFISKLEKRFDLPVHRVDERLSSQYADFLRRESGKRKARSVREQQLQRSSGWRDSQAATIILQDFLDATMQAPPLVPEDLEDHLG